jgi:hypothetical protein
MGDWRLAIGYWRLVIGDWRLGGEALREHEGYESAARANV